MKALLNFSRLAVLFLLLACILPGGAGAASVQQIRQRGTLLVGVSHVTPPYAAGAKYRTPGSFDHAVAEDLARRLGVRLVTIKVTAQNRLQALAQGQVDLLLLNLPEAQTDALRAGASLVPTAYQASPKLIMRNDTDIKQLAQLKGRSMCLAQGSTYVGTMAANYSAREKIYPAPADVLLALRTGACDAAVHDDAVLNGMLALPEWKKFSASLPLKASPARLTFALRRQDAQLGAYLQGLNREWSRASYWPAQQKKWINDVAFEVYLDQNVPDCH